MSLPLFSVALARPQLLEAGIENANELSDTDVKAHYYALRIFRELQSQLSPDSIYNSVMDGIRGTHGEEMLSLISGGIRSDAQRRCQHLADHIPALVRHGAIALQHLYHPQHVDRMLANDPQTTHHQIAFVNAMAPHAIKLIEGLSLDQLDADTAVAGEQFLEQEKQKVLDSLRECQVLLEGLMRRKDDHAPKNRAPETARKAVKQKHPHLYQED